MKTLNIDRLIPTSSVARSSGYDPEWVKSGAYRTIPYHLWLQERSEAAGLGGTTFRLGHDAPERRPDGTLDGGGSHVATREEIIARFTELGAMVAGGSPEADPAVAARAAYVKDMGDLAKRAMNGDGAAMEQAIARSLAQLRAVDPLYPDGAPGVGADFAAQFATPLDTTELITLCDETTLFRALPEITEDTYTELWRELTELDFISGSSVAFPKGECPETFEHNGENRSVDLKHIGAMKSLTESDILHSRGSVRAGYGIRELVGGFNDNGLPGESDVVTMVRQNISNVKEKEMALMSILVLNGWDQLLIDGDETADPIEFDGLTTIVTAANGARTNTGTSTGTFNVDHFNQFLVAGCARPDAVIGHPTALQDLALSYFEIGSQSIFYDSNSNIVPGYHFAGEIMTAFGPLALIADSRFPITANDDGTLTSDIYPLKMRHNGEPLVYKRTQIPLSFKDILPGCTSISFEIYAVTALVIKAMCAQARYSARWSGLAQSGCDYIHPNNS